MRKNDLEKEVMELRSEVGKTRWELEREKEKSRWLQGSFEKKL